MPRIPVFSSRVPAPGPIPGIGNDLAAPGRALARLGGAIAGFGENLARRDARKRAVERMRETQEAEDRGQPQDESVGAPQPATPEQQEALTTRTRDDVAATLDRAGDDALISVMRANAFNQAVLDSEPAQVTARALAYFDAETRQLLDGAGDPDRRARLQVLVRQNRDVLIERAEQRRNLHAAAVLNDKLATALAGYANAVRRDPAMLVAMLKKGADTIAESAQLAGLGSERIEAMTEGWIQQVHVALVEGTIEREPALALASLQSGELNGRLGNDAALIGRLTRQAKRAGTVAEAAAKQRARMRRQLFEVQKAAHLESIRKTGRGDDETEALAGTLLNAEEGEAFRGVVATAESHYAARSRYAFMTEEEIDADIAQHAPVGRPRDADKRAAGHGTRIAARDEILAERRHDPAGWAMRDATVAEAFAAAKEAALAAESPESGLAEAEQANRAFRRALALRMRVQADMGEAPRLLSEAEREALAEELQSLAPAGRLAAFAQLKRRYGESWKALVKELSGSIDRDAALLAANADDAPLAGMLARGMEKSDGKDRPVPRHLPPHDLPKADGKADIGALHPRYDYLVLDGRGESVVRLEGNALVPVADYDPL